VEQLYLYKAYERHEKLKQNFSCKSRKKEIVLKTWTEQEDNSAAGCGLDSCGSKRAPVEGSCESDNKPSGSKEGGGFLD
jgi:hypothetical protein